MNAPAVRVSHTERRRRMRAELLAATTRLLEAGQSYTELSVEQVLREAGVSRATYYAYFRNKGELLSALAEEVIDAMLANATPWWRVSGRPSEEALTATVEQIFDAYLSRHAVMAAVVEVAEYDPGVRAQLDGLVRRSIEALSAHIAAGQARGFVDPGLDPTGIAGWIVWMTERGLYKLVRGRDPQRYIRALAHTIWKTLYSVTRETP